ncbi:hypothetical protein KXD93_01200 [Mucilaginibacter sp. BJC16-A38]|uniref:hypothetical protein n=1 Tax=Mucilaginibacter phenanthrenivorans TaxID=1234842 RepID=UPI0021583EEE|nr:hypothetical protein [Mucilaginibacter phenanthrenivorans]MCR8556236.1 hypothetical protein [Mucilaginibacter phenanthrenivorans]
MDKFLQQVKKSNVWIACFMVFFGVLFTLGAQAKSGDPATPTVSITVNIIPPYSPYYADYSGVNASKVFILITNLTGNQLKIKLAGQLTGDNNVTISTYSNYTPLQPIILNAHETRQLNGLALKDIFNVNNLSVSGIDKAKLAQTSRLPEGNYNFCLQAIDFNNKQQLSAPSTGCTNIDITYPEAPILIGPVNQSHIYPTTPQAIVFNWTTAGTNPLLTQYTIEMAEMPDTKADPNQVLNATSFPILKQTVSGFSYVYNVINVPLKVGKRYAWRVTSKDPSGKVVFKNNGVSPASLFLYAPPIDPGLYDGDGATGNLFVMSPACTPRNNANNPIPVTVGPHNDLTVSWLWNDQLKKLKAAKEVDPELLKNYTQLVTPKGTVFIYKYKVDFERQTFRIHGLNEKSSYVYVFNAPDENLTFSYKQTLAQNFVLGETYTVKITAYDSKGAEIDNVTSCPWVLIKEHETDAPQLTISGKLDYSFDKGVYHGANRTSVTLQLADSEQPQYDAKQPQLVVLDPTRPQVSVTTDGEGKFSTRIPLTASDTVGKKFIVMRINSPYYAPLEKNIAVTIPKVSYSTEKNIVTMHQDPLKLGQVKTSVYTYSLKVNLKKGFPPILNQDMYNAQFGLGEAPIETTLATVDNVSIDTLSRIPAGTPVVLFRKTKGFDVPEYEGDGRVLPDNSGRIVVAQGKTLLSSSGKSTVQFENLIANYGQDDEYYIQAILPDDNPEELSGEAKKYSFLPTIYNAQLNQYSASYTYYIVSKKPPMARVKGNVMYQWPSLPGVLHPYANKKFSITMHVKTNESSSVMGPDCQTYPTEVRQVIKFNGKEVAMPFAAGPNDVLVAQGTTDAKGNFDVQIFDFMQMGSIPNLVLVQSGPLTGPTCQQQKDAQAALEKKEQEEKGKKIDVVVIVPDKKGPVESGGQGEDKGLKGALSGGVDFSKGAQLLEKTDINTSINKLDIANSKVDAVGKAIGGYEPEPGDGDYEDSAAIDVPGSVDRYFSLDGLPQVVSVVNATNGNTAGHFVVQPFATVDLGTIITNVDELKNYPINIYVNNSNSNEALTGANVVVFRAPGFKDLDGEGSFVHPIKKLLSPSFVNGALYDKQTRNYVENGLQLDDPNFKKFTDSKIPYDNKVEWILDTPLAIDKVVGENSNKGTVNLGKRRLYNNDLMYSLQITPNAENGGGEFDPVLVSLPINNDLDINEVDGYWSYSHNNYTGTKLIGSSYKDGKHISYDPHGVYLDISPSRIAGRIMDASSGKGIKSGSITLKATNWIFGKTITTCDTSGYFEVNNGQIPGISWDNNAKISLTFNADGYNEDKADGATRTIAANGNKYFYTANLVPSKKLSFRSVDAETGKNVPAYAMREDSTIFMQDSTANQPPTFHIQVTGNVSHKFTIYPQNPLWFEETVTVGADQQVATINLIRRHHRMRFQLTDANGYKLFVPNAKFKIIINNDVTKVGKLESNGDISFDFANVSVNNYNVQVIDAAGLGYIPVVFNLKNDESKLPILYQVKMVMGLTIEGTVSITKNGVSKPAKGARVYLDYSWQPDVAYNVDTKLGAAAYSLLETTSFADGSYKIKGIPLNATGPNAFKVTVHATYDGASSMVIGAETTISLKYGQNTANLNLTDSSYPNISKIWGFPLSIENADPVTVDGKIQYKISGIVDLSTNTSHLVSFDPQNKVRIKDIMFSKSLVKVEYVPVASSVPLDGVAFMRMRYLNKYNVVLKNPVKNQPLKLESSSTGGQGGGAVNATVSIVDNSFNYPSSYLSFQDAATQSPIPFYLVNNADVGKRKTPVIKAIYNTDYFYEQYHLSDYEGMPLKFLFINFPATADPANSFVQSDGKINLDVSITADVPNSNQGTIGVHVKKLILDGNSIEKTVGTEPIIVNLQTWKLEVGDWTIDPTQGGIVSSNTLVKTGIVDVKANTFNLRSDLFVLTDFDVKQISLGSGLVNLTVVDPDGVKLLFDEACGSDHGKHWRFSAVNSDPTKDVATIPIPAVPDKADAVNLGVSYFQLVSFNNENIVSLSGTQTGINLYNNKKFTFYPESIVSENNSFMLGGRANIDVPRLGDMALNLSYAKVNNILDMNPGDFGINFEGKGYVQYHSAKNVKAVVNGNITSIAGTVQEPDKINPINCTLSFGAPLSGDGNGTDPGTIKLENGYRLQLDGNSNVSAPADKLSLVIDNSLLNGMSVDMATNDWTTLKLAGPLNDPQSAEMVKTPSVYHFEVLGDIQASTDQVSMQQVTPLGKLDMVYDFATKTMHGSLHMDKVKFGTYDFTGDVQATFGPPGMTIVGAGQLNTGVFGVDGFGILNIGMVFGNANLTDDNIKTVTQYSTAKQNVCWLRDNGPHFKGFFITGGVNIIDEHDGVNLGIASAYFNAVLGVEVSVGANFTSGYANAMALVGAHGDINAGLDAITGTSISGGLSAHVTGVIAYDQNGFSLKADAGLTVRYKLSQYIPFVGTKEIGGSETASATFGVNPSIMSFSLGKGDGIVPCVQNADIQ